MKRLWITCVCLALVKISYGAMFDQGSVTFDEDSRQVSVSSFAVTAILTRDSYIYANYIVNPSTFGVCLSTYATTVAIATTTSPSMLPSSTFTLDGPNNPYWGGLWATMCGPGTAVPTTTKISVFRTK